MRKKALMVDTQLKLSLYKLLHQVDMLCYAYWFFKGNSRVAGNIILVYSLYDTFPVPYHNPNIYIYIPFFPPVSMVMTQSKVETMSP